MTRENEMEQRKMARKSYFFCFSGVFYDSTFDKNHECNDVPKTKLLNFLYM